MPIMMSGGGGDGGGGESGQLSGDVGLEVAGRVVAMVAVLPIPPHKLLMFQVVQVMQLLLFFVIYIVPYLISLGTSESTRTAMVL